MVEVVEVMCGECDLVYMMVVMLLIWFEKCGLLVSWCEGWVLFY